MKKCSVCAKPKPFDEFHVNKKSPDGRQYYCKQCKKEAYAQDRDQNRRRYYKDKYGIPVERYDEMNTGCCWICGTDSPYSDDCYAPNANKITKRFNVDHCHTTGKVRGLLCVNCNIGLGKFRDNPEFLQKAIEYLNNDTDYRYV